MQCDREIMGKAKTFAKSYALAKSKFSMKEGEYIEMYGNKYKIIASKSMGMTLLKDIKDMPVALPTEKVEKFMRENLARKLYKSSLKKGVNITDNPLNKPQPETPERPTTARTQSTNGVRMKHQLGEMRNGKIYVQRNGKRYWVNAETGSTHEAHDTDQEHYPLHHPEDLRMAADARSKILENAHSEDHERLNKKFMEYIKAAAAASHTRHASAAFSRNAGTPPPKSMIDHVNNLSDKKTAAAREFKEVYNKSVRKKRLGE